MAMEKTTIFKMGKKFGFLVIIIGKNCYRLNIGNNTWAFVDTDDPFPYDKTVIMAVSTTVTDTQHSQLESSHIRKLKNYEQLLGVNSAAQYLITVAIDIHLITPLFDNVIGYKGSYNINIIRGPHQEHFL